MNSSSQNTKLSRCALSCALFLGFVLPTVNAAVVTWDGGGATSLWSYIDPNPPKKRTNWGTNKELPTNGDDLQFDGTTGLTNTNDLTSLSVKSITFLTGAGAFVLGGNQLTFENLNTGITNNSTNLQTINMALGLNATITLAATSGNVALGGVVSGSGGITKTGTNSSYLTGANTYSGTTTITTGSLFANNASGSATGTGAISVGTSGTLGGTGTITPTGSNGMAVNGIIAPGSGTTPGTLTVNLGSTTGTVVMASSGGFQFHLGAAGMGDMFALVGASAGDFTFNNNNINFLGTGAVGSYKLFDTSSGNSNTWNGLTINGSNQITNGLTYSNLTSGYTAVFYMGGGSYGGDNGDIYVQVIPEPSAALLMALGVLTFAFRRQRAKA